MASLAVVWTPLVYYPHDSAVYEYIGECSSSVADITGLDNAIVKSVNEATLLRHQLVCNKKNQNQTRHRHGTRWNASKLEILLMRFSTWYKICI